jgi:hypothetical protein
MWKTFAALALGLILAACDVSGFVPQEHQDFAKRVVSMVQNRDDAGLQQVCDPDLWRQLNPDLRTAMAALFPAEQPSGITISSWKSNLVNNVANVQMIMVYKYSQREIQVDLAFQSAGGRHVLTRIYLKPLRGGLPMSPQNQERSSGDKSTTL